MAKYRRGEMKKKNGENGSENNRKWHRLKK
jgi:hypothetical protein